MAKRSKHIGFKALDTKIDRFYRKAVTNTYSVHVTVYITASASVTIAIGPTTVGTIPSGLVAIPLEPNQTITLTYTTAPTWVWIGD